VIFSGALEQFWPDAIPDAMMTDIAISRH